MELRDLMGRRSLVAIGVLAASLGPAAGCFSLKADDAVAGADAGSVDATSVNASSRDAGSKDGGAKDVTSDSSRDTTAPPDGDDAAEGSTEEGTIVADSADEPGDNASDEGPFDGGNASDFYVGISPPDGGTTYLTIHAALDAANASSAKTRTIHVGPGTYSSGESFPIFLRDGVSLVGSGASTILSGVGPAGISPPTGLPATSAMSNITSTDVVATIVVGDATKASTIAHLTLHGPQPAMVGAEAIVCDRGATAAPGPTVANTVIDDVTIDGFPIDLNVTSSFPIPGRPRSGCAAQMIASTLSNGWYAVVAAGWTSPVQLVSVQLGDGNGRRRERIQQFSRQWGERRGWSRGRDPRSSNRGSRVRQSHVEF